MTRIGFRTRDVCLVVFYSVQGFMSNMDEKKTIVFFSDHIPKFMYDSLEGIKDQARLVPISLVRKRNCL